MSRSTSPRRFTRSFGNFLPRTHKLSRSRYGIERANLWRSFDGRSDGRPGVRGLAAPGVPQQETRARRIADLRRACHRERGAGRRERSGPLRCARNAESCASTQTVPVYIATIERDCVNKVRVVTTDSRRAICLGTNPPSDSKKKKKYLPAELALASVRLAANSPERGERTGISLVKQTVDCRPALSARAEPLEPRIGRIFDATYECLDHTADARTSGAQCRRGARTTPRREMR